jgi:Kef-type K+ transport system membrane component KefB
LIGKVAVSLPLSDPVLVFAVLMITVLLVPLLAERIKIPDVVLLLLCGAALGPSGFGVLARNSAIMLFGAVCLVYIMFLS